MSLKNRLSKAHSPIVVGEAAILSIFIADDVLVDLGSPTMD
jgi:hypothetical protein